MRAENIEKFFGKNKVLDGININLVPHSINVIIGPSGCGKTTTLNILAGMDKDFTGQIDDIECVKKSFVFQEDRLLEWRTVKQNITFALSGKIDEEKLSKYGELMGLNEYLNHYPPQLSGGLRQRVNLLRALMYDSHLLLMDEPFKSLDIKTKEDIYQCFINIQRQKSLTVLLVTHDLEEALLLGDHINIFSRKPAKNMKTFSNPVSSFEERRENPNIKKLKQEIEKILKNDEK